MSSSLLSLQPNSYMDSDLAIPELARNFLGNFNKDDDLITPNSGKQTSNSSEDGKDSQIHEILSNVPKSVSGLHVRVLGIQQSGAKSRVETQIKLCLQVVTSGGEKVTNWDYLVLPETLVAKEKMAKGRCVEVVDRSKAIYLETKIVCASNPTKEVLSCFGCVQRERKRLMRKLEQGSAGKGPQIVGAASD